MKDYTLTAKESRDYIVSYNIKNGELIINYANGKKETLNYTKRKEEWIISRMEEQARNIELDDISTLDKTLSIIDPLTLPVATLNFVVQTNLFNTIILLIISWGAMNYPLKRIFNEVKKEDIKRLGYFLEHQDEINEYLEKNKGETLDISEKIIKKLKKKQEAEKKPINLNNIDNYSLEDLKELKEYIELEKGLDDFIKKINTSVSINREAVSRKNYLGLKKELKEEKNKIEE